MTIDINQIIITLIQLIIAAAGTTPLVILGITYEEIPA